MHVGPNFWLRKTCVLTKQEIGDAVIASHDLFCHDQVVIIRGIYKLVTIGVFNFHEDNLQALGINLETRSSF